MSREQLLALTFVELADTIGEEFDVLDFLQNTVSRSTEILGASAAALILDDQRGELQLVASTTHAAEVLELLAIATSQGPCLDAFRTGESLVNVPDDEATRRWPIFMATAQSLGYPSVHVLPMRIRSEVLGAISLLCTEPTVLDDDDLAIAEALAGVATIGLLQERTPRQKELLAEQLQTALILRVVIEQAKGVVTERTGLRVHESFDLILGFSRRHRRRLSDIASSIVDGRLTVDELREGG